MWIEVGVQMWPEGVELRVNNKGGKASERDQTSVGVASSNE